MNVTIDNGFVIVGGGRGPKGDDGSVSSVKYLSLEFTHLAGTSNPITIISENNQTGLTFTYSVSGGILSISSPTLLSEYTPIFTGWVNSNTIGVSQSFFDENRISLFLRTFGGTLRYKLALILIPISQ